MKVYNQDKTQELNREELDLEKGYFKPDKIKTVHHDAVHAVTVEEQIVELQKQGVAIEEHFDNIANVNKFYRVNAVYDGGGKDVSEIKEIPAQEAYDDEEDIQVYVPYTEAELKKRADDKRHAELKAELAKIKEDIEQERFGIVRDDYPEKKARAAEIINELRVLEGKEAREVNVEAVR